LAGKKSTSKPSKGRKEFQNNPFKALKGVAAPFQDAGQSPLPQKGPEEKLPDQSRIDDTELFAREMNLLGVNREAADEDEYSSAGEIPDAGASGDKAPAPASDEELFLTALGSMDAVFQDEIPLEEKLAAAPRRMKLLRQGRLVPEAALDLHGFSREEAREKARYFLEDSVYQGRKTVLVVTGRGKGSADGPVLRSEMQRYLANEARAWVVEWAPAPGRYGGEGALVVFLKTWRGG
jgi:DNA-nicking Smr family endonuclease